MSANIQTIPARHGTATFVPKGHSIKIINTSGTQVIDTWVFALHAPPTGMQKKEESPKEKPESSKSNKQSKDVPLEDPFKINEEGSVAESGKDTQTVSEKDSKEKGEDAEKYQEEEKGTSVEKDTDGAEDPKQANDSSKEGTEKQISGTGKSSRWSSYIPSWSSRGGPSEKNTEKTRKAPAKLKNQQSPQAEAGASQSSKWSSYVPTWSSSKTDGQAAESKGWSAYIPTGQGFSSYIPSQAQLSSFTSMHTRDPSKSYAEQLYDFSRTPVGAAGLSAATGSGYSSSLFAAYNAYNQQHHVSVPPMECMSMPHTRASTLHMRPRVNDVFVSNLREPLMTLIEDTSPGIHDTLIAACDPQRYKGLGVKDWERHGSCAENLVMSLKEFNGKIGLKGARAVGSDVTVNMVPAPLNLFMNIPWDNEGNVEFGGPKSKKGDFVRLRAERDVVVVMSSCPQDILDINGRKPQAGHFIVEDSEGKPSAFQGTAQTPQSPKSPRRQFSGAEAALTKLREQRKSSESGTKAPPKLPPKKEGPTNGTPASAKSRSSSSTPVPSRPTPSKQPSGRLAPVKQDSEKVEPTTEAQSTEQASGPKKKPKKLERRGTPKASD